MPRDDALEDMLLALWQRAAEGEPFAIHRKSGAPSPWPVDDALAEALWALWCRAAAGRWGTSE